MWLLILLLLQNSSDVMLSKTHSTRVRDVAG